MPTQTIQYEDAPAQTALPLQFGAFAAVLLLVFFIAAALNKRKQRLFEGLADFLQGSAGGNAFFQNFFFKGVFKNRPLLVKYRPGGKNSPAWLSVSLDGPPFLFGLRVSEENRFEGFLKSLGLMKELSTGDAPFDDRFYLASETEEIAGRYLAAPGVRAQIEALFNAGAHTLEIFPHGRTIPGRLEFRKRAPDLEADLSPRGLLPMLEALDALASEKHGREFFGRPPDSRFSS